MCSPTSPVTAESYVSGVNVTVPFVLPFVVPVAASAVFIDRSAFSSSTANPANV